MLRIMIKPDLLVNLQIYRRLRNLNEKEPQESFLTQLGTCTFAVFAKMNMEFFVDDPGCPPESVYRLLVGIPTAMDILNLVKF